MTQNFGIIWPIWPTLARYFVKHLRTSGLNGTVAYKKNKYQVYVLTVCKASMPFSHDCLIPSSSCAMLSFTPDNIYQPDVIRGEGRHMLIGGWAWFLLFNPSDWRILFPFVLKELELVKMHTAPQSIFLNKYLREFELKSFAWIGEAWKSGQMEMWKYDKSKIWDEANIRKLQKAYIIQNISIRAGQGWNSRKYFYMTISLSESFKGLWILVILWKKSTPEYEEYAADIFHDFWDLTWFSFVKSCAATL